MRAVPYDAREDAVLHPEYGPNGKDGPTAKTVLPAHRTPSEDLICAEASRLVYKLFENNQGERGDIEAAFNGLGFSQFTGFDRGGSSQAFAMWRKDDKTALVVFRGTQQKLTDFAADLNVEKRDWELGGWVHGGFLKAFDEIWSDIKAWLEMENHAGNRLFTGHSLGAALATLAASASLKSEGTETVRLVTIGSPRVGSSDFVETLSKASITRYVDCCDIVCQLPPAVFGFQHVLHKTYSYIDHDGHVRINLPEDEIREDQHEGREDYFLHHSWRRGEVEVRDLADHAPINYVNVLLNL